MKVKGGIDKFYNYGFPIQAVLITCKDRNDDFNVFTVAWHTPVSRYPPLFGIFVSKKRYSRDLIEESGEFVVNFMPFDLVEKVDFCGTHSGEDTDKLKETGLTVEKGEIETPYIKESTACFECKIFDHTRIGDHSFFVGKIKNVLFEESLFEGNILDVDQVSPCYYLGGGIYTKISDIKKAFD
ncbi:MAG: flavin reductase family protein [Candidatus Thermoplasmatota archaeon]